MQMPADVAALAHHSGPFATAYLDTTHTSESGAKEVELRWRALREELESRGAGAETLSAITAPEHDRLDAALVRALAASSARILVTPDAHAYLDDGIGALLRYTDRGAPA